LSILGGAVKWWQLNNAKPLKEKMKTRTLARLLGMMLALGAAGAAHAMSSLVGVSIQPQWPATGEPGTVVLYTVTVERAGEGDLVVMLSCDGLPDGATATFSPSVARFTGRVPTTSTVTMTITCTNMMATDPYPFTVTAVEGVSSLVATNKAGKNFDSSFASNPLSRPILAVDPVGKQNMKVRGKGATGITYQIEAASSLENPSWKPLGLSRADGNGRFSYMDSAAAPGNLFYRASGPIQRSK
jgi:hypothetical protein